MDNNKDKQVENVTDWQQHIADYVAGQCTDEEKRVLEDRLQHNPEAARLFRQMSAVWALASLPGLAERKEENFEKVKRRITACSLPPKRATVLRNLSHWWLKVAAVVAVLLACNGFWYYYSNEITHTYVAAETPYEVKVPAGSRTQLTLPDGTKVVLNAGSTLKYNRGFGIESRHVWLDGEGYFEVYKDARKPFLVETDDVQVQVLGTIFDVCAYKSDEYVSVSLLEGCVNLRTASGENMELNPNEQALYDRMTGSIRKLKPEQHRIDWLDGGIAFDNMPFADIAHRLERKFQLNIQIESERLKHEHFSGSFDESQSILDILEEIDVEGRYDWRMEDKIIYITDKKKGGSARQ